MKHKKDEFVTSESDVYNFWKSKLRTLTKLDWNMEISSVPCESDICDIQLLWYDVFLNLIFKKREENDNLKTQFLLECLNDKHNKIY